jgi:hypothetical protein
MLKNCSAFCKIMLTNVGDDSVRLIANPYNNNIL